MKAPQWSSSWLGISLKAESFQNSTGERIALSLKEPPDGKFLQRFINEVVLI